MKQEYGYLRIEYTQEQVNEACNTIKQALKETDVKACLRRLLEDQRRR